MKYVETIKKNKHLLIAFLFLAVISISQHFFYKDKDQTPAPEPMDATTMIPRDHVLVPVDFSNFESLNALIKDYGIIDLYKTSDFGNKSKRVAQKVKVIRAPYNPNLFAVLVHDSVAQDLMKESGPFWGAIQNTNTPSGEIKKASESKIKNVQVEYYN